MRFVLVSQNIDFFKDRNEFRDTLDHRLSRFVLLSGYLPIPVPNGLYDEKITNCENSNNFVSWVKELKISAVILSGGNDIGSSKQRDGTEGCILNYAEKNVLPVLGICRGMQMLGVRAGSNIKSVLGHVSTTHKLIGEIVGEVNSYHNYSLFNCPKGYSVIAKSEDGEIEAIKHNFLPWEGWMWHPERNKEFNSNDIKRLKHLFDYIK